MLADVERDGYTQLDTGFHIHENKDAIYLPWCKVD
jgi:hypothetical protein